MDNLKILAQTVIQWGALTLLFGFGIGILMIVVIYLIDFNQTCQTIRRNYLVVGRFRYLFEHLGEFFFANTFLQWTGKSYPLIDLEMWQSPSPLQLKGNLRYPLNGWLPV